MDDSGDVPKKHRSRNLALWIFFILLLQELLVRIVFPVPEILNFDRLSYSPLFVDASASRTSSLAHASFRWTSVPDGAESVHNLNLYGFRDRTWPTSPRDRELRVAIVGDSMVEGFLANQSETIPAMFREALRRDGRNVETMNLGIGAARLPEYVRLIRDVVPLFRPGHVILILYENDFRPSAFDPEWLREPMSPARSHPGVPRLWYVLRSQMEHGFAPRRWRSATFDFLPPIGDPRNPWSNQEHATWAEGFIAPEISSAIRRGEFNPFAITHMEHLDTYLVQTYDSRPHLAALKSFLERNETSFGVVYLPALLQVSDRYLEPQRRMSESSTASFLDDRFLTQAKGVEAQCAELGIPFLDLTPELRELEAGGRVLYWSYDAHLTADGYAAAGEAIATWWLSKQP